MQDHIATAFDRDLHGLQALIMRMGGLVETEITEAAKALEERDEELAQKVRGDDVAVDALEEQIKDEAARVIALRQPAATDLRTVLSVLAISANLERCGDYAKNMAKRTAVLAHMSPVGGTSKSLRRMTREVSVMLKDALDAFVRRDLKLAEKVRMADQDVDQMYNALFREFLTHMMEDPRNITASMHLHFIAKNVERMGDHATAIAEESIYLITGKRPNIDRPKGGQELYDPAGDR
jgi:phosphate transport system protein